MAGWIRRMMEISFYRGHPPFRPPLRIDSIALSGLTFVSGVDAFVGLVTTYMSTSPFTGSLAVGGADAASFKIVGSNLVTNGTVAAGTYSITLIATQATANNSPFTSDPFTITGTGNVTSNIFTRTINADTTSAVPAAAYWMMGVPLVKGHVPTGNIVQIKHGATTLRSSAIRFRLPHNDSSLGWCFMLADLSTASLGGGGASIPAGTTYDLTGVSTPGSWQNTAPAGRGNADWQGLADTLELTNQTTTGTTTGNDNMQKAGTWVATFDGTATVKNYGNCDVGSMYEVTANFINTGTTHRFLKAFIYYLVFYTPAGAVGGIASLGPYIDNTYVFTSSGAACAQFDYDANFKRAGVSVRSIAGNSNPALTYAVMCRPDGQWDWNANDPKVWISQDYAQTGLTKKMARFLDASPGVRLTYVASSWSKLTNAVLAIDGSGNCSTANIQGLVQQSGWDGTLGPRFPGMNSVQFTGTLPTGGQLAANTTYWINYSGATDGSGNYIFTVYDTKKNAIAGGATGKITPTGYLSGLNVHVVCGPMAQGLFNMIQAPGGAQDRPDVGVYSEWECAYHIGNTKDLQDLARFNATCMSTYPAWATESTGTIPAMIPSASEAPSFATPAPAGMCPAGASRYRSFWQTGSSSCSTDINGGNFSGITSTTGTWWWAPDYAHRINSIYGVWLMEGNPFLQKLLLQNAASAVANFSFGSNSNGTDRRNPTVLGTKYYAISYIYDDGINARTDAWGQRDAAFGWFAAEEDSNSASLGEKSCLKNQLQQNLNFFKAVYDWRSTGASGANFAKLGICTGTQGVGGSIANMENTVQGIAMFCFHENYKAVVYPIIAMLAGEVINYLQAEADFTAQLLTDWYASGVTYCSVYATEYSAYYGTADKLVDLSGAPSPQVGSPAEIAIGQGSDITVTFTNGNADLQISAALPFNPVAGDKVRFQNYTSNNGVLLEAARAPASDGVDYTVSSYNSTTRKLRIINPATGLDMVPTASSVDGTAIGVIPTSHVAGTGTCLTTGTLDSDTDPYGYLVNEMGALAIYAANGYISTVNGNPASTSYINAKARYAASFPSSLAATHAKWAFNATF